MDADDKKDVYRILMYVVLFTGYIVMKYVPQFIVDPEVLYILFVGGAIVYNLFRKIVMRKSGLTKEEIEDIEDDIPLTTTGIPSHI